jgi:HD superfamily phosphohydrolase
MYWQVYLHKAVVAAEKMLVRIIERAQELIDEGIELNTASTTLDFFLKQHQPDDNFIKHLESLHNWMMPMYSAPSKTGVVISIRF